MQTTSVISGSANIGLNAQDGDVVRAFTNIDKLKVGCF